MLKLINVNGKYVADSREVAEMTDKRHDHLLRDIENYVQTIDNSETPNLGSLNFFIPSTYTVEGNTKSYPCYLLTRKGCDMVANKMTGEKGILFTAAYVTKFEEMEKVVPKVQELSPQLQVLINLELEQKKIKEEISEVKTTLYLVKDTVANHPEENWRDTINRMFNRIVKSVGNEKFQDLRNESYSLLECRANCDLSTRLRNYRKRLEEAGETKTKINKANKLDVIESDSKLKEIYTGIIKELTIKHVA